MQNAIISFIYTRLLQRYPIVFMCKIVNYLQSPNGQNQTQGSINKIANTVPSTLIIQISFPANIPDNNCSNSLYSNPGLDIVLMQYLTPRLLPQYSPCLQHEHSKPPLLVLKHPKTKFEICVGVSHLVACTTTKRVQLQLGASVRRPWRNPPCHRSCKPFDRRQRLRIDHRQPFRLSYESWTVLQPTANGRSWH